MTASVRPRRGSNSSDGGEVPSRAAISHANRSQALPLRFYFSSGRGESLGTRLIFIAIKYHHPETRVLFTVTMLQGCMYTVSFVLVAATRLQSPPSMPKSVEGKLECIINCFMSEYGNPILPLQVAKFGPLTTPAHGWDAQQ